MQHARRSDGFASLASAASCGSRPKLGEIVLSYSENNSFCEDCPTFKVDFRSSGAVKYECSHACTVSGTQRYSVPPQRFKDLLREFHEKRFLDLPSGGSYGTDAIVFRLTYRHNYRVHEVVDDSRQNAAITKLEDHFRAATEVNRFQKP